jgi:hypothetical protein
MLYITPLTALCGARIALGKPTTRPSEHLNGLAARLLDRDASRLNPDHRRDELKNSKDCYADKR